MHFGQFEVGKQVAGEHCLGDPDEAAPGHLLESDPRAENSHALELTKMRCCDVFVFWLRPQAIPRQFCAVCLVALWVNSRLHVATPCHRSPESTSSKEQLRRVFEVYGRQFGLSKEKQADGFE
jgi:hypothetical protein